MAGLQRVGVVEAKEFPLVLEAEGQSLVTRLPTSRQLCSILQKRRSERVS